MLMNLTQILRIIVRNLGDSWPYADVTSAQLSTWQGGIPTKEAKTQLDVLVKAKYAIQTGREHKSQKIECYGAPCCTYGLVSDRVRNLLRLNGI